MTILIPMGFQRVAMNVGNCSAGVHNVIPDPGNNREGVHDVTTNFGNDGMGITMGVRDGSIGV